MDTAGAALPSADRPSTAASTANGLDFRLQPVQKTTTLSTIVVNSGGTRVVIALVQTKDWLELKVLELTPALTLLGIDLEEALQLQKAHNDVLIRIQSKQSPVEEMLRQADRLIVSQKGKAEVYAAMADSLALAWRDVNTQLQRRKTILDLNVKYHRNAMQCLERTRALEMGVCSGAPLPVEVSAIEDLLDRLNQARRAMLESLMLALQDGRCLLDELQSIAQEGTLDSRPDQIRTAANCAVSQVEHWLENLHDRRRLLEVSYNERKIQLEQCLTLALLTIDLRQLEGILEKRQESLARSRDELGDSEASSQLLLHEHRKLMPEAKDLQERGLKILKASEQLAESGHFAGEEAVAQAYKLLNSASEYIEDTENRDSLLMKANSFFRSAQTAITKLDQLEVQLNTADFTATPAQLAALYGNITRAIENATESALQEGYALLDSAPGSESVKRRVEEIESRKIQLNVMCVESSERSIKTSKVLNNFLEKQNQLYSWLVSTAQSFIQGHQDMGSVLAMAKDFLQQHNKMLNELQMKNTEINALISTLPSTLDTLDVDSQRDCKEKAEELIRQSNQLKESLERRTELARTYVKFHSLAVELASDMDALDDILHSSNITNNALNSCKHRWLNVQQVFLQFVNTGTNFTEDSFKVGDPYLDVEHSRLCVSTLIEHFTTRKSALTARHSQCEQALFNRQQTASLWHQTMADANQTVDWVSKLDSQLYPVMNEEITSSLQMSKDIEYKMKTVLPEVKKALTEVQSRIRTANDLIGTGEVPNRDDSVLIKLKELEDKLHNMVSDYQVLLEMLISFFKNLSELENKCTKPTGALGEPTSMDSVEHMIKDHDANRQALSELFRFTHSESLQIIDKIKIQEPEPARERDISTLRRMVEDKRSLWERSWTERRLELEQCQQLCQFDVDLEHIYKNIEQLEQQLISVRGQYGESLATAKATSLTFLYFEKTIELLQQRIETFVSAAEVMSKTDENSSKHIQVEVSRLRKRWEEFEKQVSESRRLIDLSIQFFTLVEEAEDWFREGSQLLVTIARRSAVSKTPEDATEMLNELEIFFKPGESIQDERINKIADLAEQLFVGEARPPAQVSQVQEESREMKNSFQQVTKELKSLLESYKQPEKMDVSASEPPVIIKQEQQTTTHVTSTEKTVIEVIENGVTTVRKHKSPSPPPKKAKYQEIEAITSPPQFSQPLADAVINEGSKFTFQCRVAGKPSPSIQWLKDGMSIDNNPDYLTKFDDDGLCSLTIEETFTEDSALFTCRAMNPAGSTDTSAKLTVKECAPEVEMIGPIFLQPLLSVTGVEGCSCSMTCQVDGNPLPTVQWSKGDICIDHSPDYCITFNNGLAVMTIEQLAPGDQAQYTCKATNPVASDSSTAWLFVKPKKSLESPKFISPLSTNLMARAGQKIRLECQVAGKPTPTVTWSFNEKPIKESKDHLQILVENGNATLIINEAYPKDAGVYSVNAVNSAGEASQSCQVSVKGLLPTETSDSELASDSEPIKPSIQLQLKDCAVFEGMKVRLDCIIVGQPEPEVIWYHEERPVKESEDFQLLFHGDRCSLIIQEAYVEDSGDYKVVAINSAGEASSKCQLTVQSVGGSEVKGATRQSVEMTREKKLELPVCSMPKFTQLLTDVLVPVGESVTLECTVSGQPMPVVAWLHNSRSILPSDRIKWEQTEDGHCTLHIDNVTVEDKGNYTALVQSKMGEAKCFAHLIVKGSISDQEAETKIKHDDRPVLPSFTELFSDKTVYLGEPTKFECIVAGKPTPKVRWLFNDKPVAGKDMLISTSGPRQVLSIPSVTIETAGQITCLAENEAGKAACTAKLAISDAPIDILLPTLENIKLSETEGFEMKRQVVSESSSSRVYSSGTTITTNGATTVATDQQPTVQIQSVSSRSEVASHKIGDEPVVQVERHETMEYQQKDGLVSEQKTELKSKSIGGVTSVDKTSSTAIQPAKRKLIPPKFSTLVMGKIVDQGVDISLEGIVDGFPQPDIKWLKNGEELVPGPNLNMSQDLNRVKLTISSVSASDAGKYTCTASNSAGTASCTADLVVKKTVFPPVMGRRLQASARTVGERIVMEIEVTGTPDPEVKWYKDGQQIPASSSMFELRHYGNCHALVIERATQSHSGKYTVCAANSAGEAKSTADLLVQQPQLPMDIIEQTTTNITSSHEVIHHPQPMKSIENLTSSESLRKDSHKELLEKSMKTSSGSGKEILLGDTVSVIETVKTDKQVSLKLSHTSGTSSWSDEKLEFSSYGKKTPIPIIESPLPFHPPTPYLKEEISTITPEMQQVDSVEKEASSEDKSIIEESHIAKKDALNFFKNIISENRMEEEKLHQHMSKSTVSVEPRPLFKEPLFNQEYLKSEQSSIKSFEQQSYQQDSLFDLEPGPPPEMGFIPKTPTTVLKKEDVFERVKKLEESHRTLSEEEIPTGAVKIFPSSGKSEPSVSAISSSIPVTLQAAAAVTPSLFMPESYDRQIHEKVDVSSKKEILEEIIVPERIEPAGSDEKTVVKKNHFLENYSNFESSLSPVFRPQADIIVRPQSPRPSAEAVSMEKLWTSRQKETVEISQSSQGAWKPVTPEPVQQPTWKPSPLIMAEQPEFKPPSPEPMKEPPWKHVQPPQPTEHPVWKPVVSPAAPQPVVKPIPQPVEKPVWKQPPPPIESNLPPWQSIHPEPSHRSSSPLPSAEAVAMEKLWSHKHSESSLKTVWPPPLPSDLIQQAPWVEKIKTDLSMPVSEVQTVNVEKEHKMFSHKSFTEKVSKETKSFSSQFKSEDKFSNSVSQAPSFVPQKPMPPPPVVDAPKIIYVAEAHASHSMNLPSQQISTVSEISTSSISKSEFSETSENVVEERTLKPSEAKALWDSTPKNQDSYVPPPKKVQPKEKKPLRPYSAHELNFDDLHLEPGPPPEMGFAQPPALDRRLSQIELIEQDLEKDLEKEPSRQLVGAVRIIPPPKKEASVERTTTASTIQQTTSSKQSRTVEFKRSTSLDKDSKLLDLEPFPYKPEPEKPKPKVFGKVPKPSKFVKKSFTESDYESDVDKARIPPMWMPYESDSEGPTYRKVRPNFTKTQPKRPHSVATVCDVSPPSQFERPQPLCGPSTPTLPAVNKQQVSESKFQETKVDFQSKNTIVRQFQSSVEKSSCTSSNQTTLPVASEPSRSPEVEKSKQESPKSKQKMMKVAAPDSGYMADTDEPRHSAVSVSQMSSSFSSSQSQVHSQETISNIIKPSTQKQSLWKPSVPSSVSAAVNKESVSSQVVEQNKLTVSQQQQQQQRPAKRSVGPPPCSPSKFVKGEFRESDYESDYEGRIPVKWRPPQNVPDVENREFKPVHPVLEVSKRLGSNRDGRTPTPPSAFDVPPQTSTFTRTKDIFENSQLVKPKALTAVSVPSNNVGFQLKPGSPPKMDYAAPSAPYYKIPTGSVGLETSNSMSFAEATESSKRVVSMQQTTRVIKFDDNKKTKRSQIIRPVTSDVESDYESGKVKTSWPPENPLQFEAEQKRLQRVEEMRRRFSDKTSTPPVLTPGEPPQYGFIEPHRTIGQSTVDASSLANKHMNEMTHSFKSKAQKFASDVMTDVQVTKHGKTENSLQKTTSEKADDSQAYREESRLSEYGKKQIDPDTGLIYFKYDFGYEFGVVMPGEGKQGSTAKGLGASKIKTESSEGSVPVPVIHETTRKSITSGTSAKRLAAKSVKWEQTSESELSDTGIDVARRKKQPTHSQQYEPHILIPQTPTPQSLSPSLHSLSPYFTHAHDSTVSPGSSLASGLSPGGVVPGVSPVVNPSTVPEHARKAPLFITPLRNIAVLTGNAARFECIVQAEPAPNILWAHDGRILQPSDMHNIQFRNGVCRLTMPKAELSDGGTYTCTATNLLGTAGTTASLQVSGERRSLLV